MAYNVVDALERAKKVKMVVLDVHGVLTSGTILYNEEGVKFQAFHHDDGFGANTLLMCGVDVALMTRKSKIVDVRAAEVGIKHVLRAKDKGAKLQEVSEEFGIGLDEICFVGDGRNNVANSLMIGCAKMGVHFTTLAPKALYPEQGLVDQSRVFAERSGAEIHVSSDDICGRWK